MLCREQEAKKVQALTQQIWQMILKKGHRQDKYSLAIEYYSLEVYVYNIASYTATYVYTSM